jgi:hypothetical protein
MPPNLKTAVEDREDRGGWDDNGSASFIDIVISQDMVLNKRSDGARRSSSSSSHRPNAMAKGNGNAWYARTRSWLKPVFLVCGLGSTSRSTVVAQDCRWKGKHLQWSFLKVLSCSVAKSKCATLLHGL